MISHSRSRELVQPLLVELGRKEALSRDVHTCFIKALGHSQRRQAEHIVLTYNYDRINLHGCEAPH